MIDPAESRSPSGKRGGGAGGLLSSVRRTLSSRDGLLASSGLRTTTLSPPRSSAALRSRPSSSTRRSSSDEVLCADAAAESAKEEAARRWAEDEEDAGLEDLPPPLSSPPPASSSSVLSSDAGTAMTMAGEVAGAVGADAAATESDDDSAVVALRLTNGGASPPRKDDGENGVKVALPDAHPEKSSVSSSSFPGDALEMERTMSELSVNDSVVSASSSTATPRTGNQVSFAFPPPSSLRSSVRRSSADLKAEDALRSREELVGLVSELREKVSRYGVDLSAEKALRKKKEKNLFKLAKELNGRAEVIEEKSREIDGLLASQTALETKLATAQEALADLIRKSESDARSHHEEITSLQSKLRSLRLEHDDRVAELTTSHERQCEELRKEALRANLDADRMRMERAREEMRREPERAGEIMERTMKESAKVAEKSRGVDLDKEKAGMAQGKKMSEAMTWGVIMMTALLANLLRWAYYGYRDGFFSTNALCAPVYPGTVLAGEESVSFEAPWFAPVSLKEAAFGGLCIGGGRVRTRLDWSLSLGVSSGQSGTLTVTEIVAGGTSGAVLLERRAISVEVQRDGTIVLTDKKGKETSTAPWVSASR